MPDPIIGVDAEWQTNENGNSVLSYQWYGIDGNDSWSGIHYPDLSKTEDKKRLSLNLWVEYALKEHYKGRTWPDRIVLASHYVPAEMSVVKDFKNFKHSVDIIQGSSYATLTKPIPLTWHDRSKNKRTIMVYIADTMTLAPADGKKLEALGEILNIPKHKLPKGYKKSDMQRFMKERPAEFKSYAIRDAEIAARYLESIQKECGDLGLNNKYRPITVGGLAVNMFTKQLKDNGRTYDNIMGVTRGSRSAGNRVSVATRTYSSELVTKNEDLAIRCYHGGRNECFLFGSFNETFTDYDLEGAYATALTAVIEPDYDNLKETSDINDCSPSAPVAQI